MEGRKADLQQKKSELDRIIAETKQDEEKLREKAKITLVSATSIVEGGSHDVILKDKFGRD